MRSAQEGRRSADDCAHEARSTASLKQREMLFALARTWETLARQTQRLEAQRAEDEQSRRIEA